MKTAINIKDLSKEMNINDKVRMLIADFEEEVLSNGEKKLLTQSERDDIFDSAYDNNTLNEGYEPHNLYHPYL